MSSQFETLEVSGWRMVSGELAGALGRDVSAGICGGVFAERDSVSAGVVVCTGLDVVCVEVVVGVEDSVRA